MRAGLHRSFWSARSYGTNRAAGLSDHLLNHGIALNGILLVSSILNFQTASFAKGNDLPYIGSCRPTRRPPGITEASRPGTPDSLTETLAEASAGPRQNTPPPSCVATP